jgi:predicted nucleic acid-binding protein
MKIYEESLEEMRQKLDIGQLMEKLTFYDRSLNVLFDESQLKLLYLQEKFNFQEVRDERNMLGLR